MTYEPKLGEVVRGVGRSGIQYTGAFRQHMHDALAGWSTLSLQATGRAAGRVYVTTDSLEPLDPIDDTTQPTYCELCGEEENDETGIFWDAVGRRNVVAHARCGADAGFTLA